MATIFDVIFLGSATDLDPTEGDTNAENAGAITGTTFGGGGDPLYGNIQSWSPGITGYGFGATNWAYDTDNSTSNDTFSIDGGSDQTTDSVITYNATVTYTDGSTNTLSVIVVQDTSGNLYVVPQQTLNSDQAALEANPIESLTLDSVHSSDNVLTGDRYAPDYVTTVDGTSGDDDMQIGYTDADGDQNDDFDGVVDAGAGNDTINAGGGDDIVHAGDGNDVIEDWAGNDTIFGGAGDDTAYIGPGDDFIDMGAGDDLAIVWDNSGDNTIFGGDDFDTLDFENWQSSDGVSATFTGDGAGTFSHYLGGTTGSFTDFEAIAGTEYADTIDASADSTGLVIDGDEGDDLLTGGAGADTITGGLGADAISAGDGDDIVSGGDGDDSISGNAGDDAILGGGGHDILEGEGGADYILGGDGNDVLIGYNSDNAFGGSTAVQSDDGSNDTLVGGAGDDSI